MDEKTYIFEGKTTNEAIEKGLKELKVSRNNVDIKVLEQEEKRSFFSILTPRVVKVEMKIINEEADKKVNKDIKKEKKDSIENRNNIDLKESKKIVEKFLEEFFSKISYKDIEYKVSDENGIIFVNIDGADASFLIGYRGEVMSSFQDILVRVLNNNTKEKIKVAVDVCGYRNKREKALENLALKISKTVEKNGKKIVLEPMSAFERKIIHTYLQSNNKVKTYSIGDEPHRKVVVDVNK